jgi:hypothetical protein
MKVLNVRQFCNKKLEYKSKCGFLHLFRGQGHNDNQCFKICITAEFCKFQTKETIKTDIKRY